MLRIDKSKCDICGTCISICPENALELSDSLCVDQQKCILCNLCVDVCPFGALHISSNKDKELQKEKNGSTKEI